MRTANITTSIAVLLWLCLALLGRDGETGVAGRMGGSVNIVQYDYYALWPTYVAAGLLGCAWACNTLRRWYWFLTLTSGAGLLALLPFLFFYAGGM